MQSAAETGKPESHMLTRQEAAALLGIGKTLFYKLLAAGKVPSPVKIGEAYRWSRSKLVGWIEAGCPDVRTWEASWSMRHRRAAS